MAANLIVKGDENANEFNMTNALIFTVEASNRVNNSFIYNSDMAQQWVNVVVPFSQMLNENSDYLSSTSIA